MEVVLDSSLALAWALPDEVSERADIFLRGVVGSDALWVPALWWYEIANGLSMAQRRKRIAEADVQRLLRLYGKLPIHTEADPDADAAWRYASLAREYEISAYDGAYLDLAQRRGLGLASLDQRLLEAARKAGVATP